MCGRWAVGVGRGWGEGQRKGQGAQARPAAADGQNVVASWRRWRRPGDGELKWAMDGPWALGQKQKAGSQASSA